MAEYPTLRVDSVRRIVNDGNHNAFTDMCSFHGEMYLAFRSSPISHDVTPNSRIVILTSRDGVEWRQAHAFSVRDRDVRDPHFMVFRDTLFVYSGTWFCDPARPGKFYINEHLGYAVWTRDGKSWEGPRALEGTYGHYIWRAAAHGDKAYLCGRRMCEFYPGESYPPGTVPRESALLESEDGLVWKFTGLFQETGGNETAFLFEEDGEILAIARANDTLVCRSRPPYREWTRKPLGRFVGGPLVVRWGKHTLVGGRKFLTIGAPDKKPRTVLSWLVDDKLIDVAELPSGGDNSYPGFIALSDTKALLSYYSSHEGSGTKMAPCAIYLAELSVQA